MWREMLPTEHDQVQFLLDEQFKEALPSADRGTVIVYDIDGKIKGLAVLHFVLHLEPVWLDPSARSYGLTALKALGTYLENEPAFKSERGFVATALSPEMARMHRLLGFEEIGEGKIMRRMRNG